MNLGNIMTVIVTIKPGASSYKILEGRVREETMSYDQKVGITT